MDNHEWYNANIKKIAHDYNVTSAKVEFEMKAALESAKDNPNFKAMFGDSMPSVEEFIETIVDMLLIL